MQKTNCWRIWAKFYDRKIKNPKSADELNSGVLKLKNRFKELGFSSTTSGNKITLSFKELKEIDKLLAKLSKV